MCLRQGYPHAWSSMGLSCALPGVRPSQVPEPSLTLEAGPQGRGSSMRLGTASCLQVGDASMDRIVYDAYPHPSLPLSGNQNTSSQRSVPHLPSLVLRETCGLSAMTVASPAPLSTWFLVLYAEFIILFVMLIPSRDYLYSIINGIVFNLLAFLALASRVMLTDPGAVPKGNATKEFIESLQPKPGQVVYKCPKCCSSKPNWAHHCSVCKRCIHKMDHHCPWVNNCVGKNNQKYFVLFTMYIALISLHALIMVGFHFLHCFEEDWTKCSSFLLPTTVILLILLCFEALLLLIFTSVMFETQVHSFCTDETE